MLQKIRDLSKSLAIYGLGDVAIQALNFLLLPVYVRYLSSFDYGVLALLLSVEAAVKLFFRWGIDGAFMRFWYDCTDDGARERLASTLLLFLLPVNGALLILSLIFSPLLSRWVLGAPGYTLALQLVLINTFALGFTFIPLHVLRMENKPGQHSAITFARSAATLVIRLCLVIGAGLGLMGVVIADVVVTGLLLGFMLPLFARLIRPVFSRRVLRQALAFGLPRIPHGLALQVMAVGDRFVLRWYGAIPEVVGVYSIGVGFGLIPKFALAAFESAWAPFYYATAREPNAQRVFSAVTTYGVAALALMTAGLSAIAADLLDIATGGQYIAAAGVVTWTAVAVFFNGVYLLTSIGLNLTSRTRYYPVSTAIGAGVNLGLNFLLIPRFGMIGAAWANAASYAIQAAVAFTFSQRFYPVRYELRRLARVMLAAAIAYLVARAVPSLPPLAGMLARGIAVVVVMTTLLWATGFFNAEELKALDALRRRNARRAPVTHPPEISEGAGEVVAVDLPEPGIALPISQKGR